MASASSPSWKRFIAPTVQVAVLVAVVWFLTQKIGDEWERISEDAGKLAFDPFWLTLAGVLYLVGMLPCGLFWQKVLYALGATPTTFETLRAYYIGHLGKYVPSKALVVVIRVALLRGRATTATAALAVLYETLTMMAIGAVLGSFILVVLWRGDAMMLVMGALVASLAGAIVFPPIFRELARRAGLKRIDPDALEKLSNLDFADFITSVLGIATGWFFIGASVWSVIQALDPHTLHFREDVMVCTAAAALSVVFGFVSLLPGGAGVREWVLITLLGPMLETSLAAPVVVAVVVRIVWTSAEAILAAVLYVAGKWFVRPALVEPDSAPSAGAPAESSASGTDSADSSVPQG
ncbi:MAG TPA: lysylphosphatidylglycerol synthase transmembrane domain-containing protein [Pirellulales bacterium]